MSSLSEESADAMGNLKPGFTAHVTFMRFIFDLPYGLKVVSKIPCKDGFDTKFIP